jgi:hypothetical protein
VPVERAPLRRVPDGLHNRCRGRSPKLVAADRGAGTAESTCAERAEQDDRGGVSREFRHSRSSCILLP